MKKICIISIAAILVVVLGIGFAVAGGGKEKVYLMTEEVNYDGDNRLVIRYKYEYNEYGEVIQKSTDRGYEPSITCFEYDDDGNLISIIGYDEDGEVFYREKREYDDHGNQISHSAGNTVKWYYEYVYDDNGNVIVKKFFDGEKIYSGETHYEYDDAGNVVCAIDYDSAGTETFRYVYEYDETGNEVTEIEYRNGIEMTSRKYAKDDNGDHKIQDPNYDYEYDDHGNVIVLRDPETGGRVEYTYEEIKIKKR